MGGIVSNLQFLGYKVDQIQLEVQQNLASLVYPGQFVEDQIQLDIGFRRPIHFTGKSIYVGGINVTLKIFLTPEKKPEEWYCQGSFGISGAFHVNQEGLQKETLERLVKIQIPAILFPYLRGAISSVLCNAGIGAILLPLINVPKFAEELLTGVSIEALVHDQVPQQPHPTPTP